MTSGCPSIGSIFAMTGRAMPSAAPPVVYPSTRRIGFAGQPWANAASDSTVVKTKAAKLDAKRAVMSGLLQGRQRRQHSLGQGMPVDVEHHRHHRVVARDADQVDH